METNPAKPSPAVRTLATAFNGLDGTTGDPLFPPMSIDELAGMATGPRQESPSFLRELRRLWQRISDFSFTPMEGIDPWNLAEAGWGLVTVHGADPAVLDALRPLRELRREQAGERYRELVGPEAYRPGESKLEFLARHGVGPGPVDPEKVPYYLLLVGSPEEIPFQVQYQLDVQHAVGRIAFDTVEEYARYAERVVAAERGDCSARQEAVVVGVSAPGDQATEQSRRLLAEPLAGQIRREAPEWQVATVLGAKATKDRLLEILTRGRGAPALVFTASHGVGFPEPGDPRQRDQQGALVCHAEREEQAWEDRILSGLDLPDDCSPGPMILFTFACYGAGTPHQNSFRHRRGGKPEPDIVAPVPFVARLPQRLLGHPAGGALAVVGHVDRAWGYSFIWPGAGAQTEVFASTFRRLLGGCPVGHALEFFDTRYAEISTELEQVRQDIHYGSAPDPAAVAGLWTANNDARSYILLGDPAVHLAAI
jgi:hypothetical protein